MTMEDAPKCSILCSRNRLPNERIETAAHIRYINDVCCTRKMLKAWKCAQRVYHVKPVWVCIYQKRTSQSSRKHGGRWPCRNLGGAIFDSCPRREVGEDSLWSCCELLVLSQIPLIHMAGWTAFWFIGRSDHLPTMAANMHKYYSSINHIKTLLPNKSKQCKTTHTHNNTTKKQLSSLQWPSSGTDITPSVICRIKRCFCAWPRGDVTCSEMEEVWTSWDVENPEADNTESDKWH